MSAAAINVNQLSFSYDKRAIISDLELQLLPGQMVGLIGPNGAGKSTLLRLLLGISEPDSGKILIQGQSLTKISRRKLARLVTMVPQDSQINYAFTVAELVAMGRNPWVGRFQPPGSNDLAIIEQAMQQTDVLRFADRPIQQLSGGERQRVLIARAIAQQTPIILLDEATANLDICHQLEVLALAQTLARQGRLVIAAIHDLALASRFCDRLLLLAEQRLQANGCPQEVITPANLRRFFHLHAEVHALTQPNSSPGLMITALGSVKEETNHATGQNC